MDVLFLVVGLAVGGVAAWLVARSRIARLQVELDHERRGAQNAASWKDEVEQTLKVLSAELHQEAKQDLEHRQRAVEQVVAPIQKSLEKVNEEVRELERARGVAYGALSKQLESLVQTQERLRTETASLVTALRAPAVRGRWGEVQLRRVVEAAGMLPYCDFVEQATASADGRALRPDLIVKLPGAKQVIVDAKTPLSAYLDALEASDEHVQLARLRDHARQLREHVGKLSAKSYWEQFESTPDFVVLFVPGDPFFAAALDQDPALQEDAWRQRVVLATPSTLIGLLFVVAYGWRQEKLAESARRVSELGRDLYQRLGTLAGHVVKLGRSLDGAVGAYNEAVGSLERRVLVTARQFPELGVSGGGELPTPEPIERTTRALQAPEFADGPRPVERDAA
jgi:DNA recombination protein RmuC